MDTSRSKGDLTTRLMHRRSVLQLGALAGAMLPVPGSRAVAKPTTRLHFVGWQYNPQIVAENVATFEKLYDENVDYQLVAGEYQALLETMLIAGKMFDMMYSEEATLARWVAANWARDVEDMPDVAAIKESMVPVGVRNLSLPNGKLGGLPYYAGYNAFVFNEAHLDKAKIQPPTTWEELLASARKLKRDKIADYPYVSHWEHTGPAYRGVCLPSGILREQKSSTASLIRYLTTSSRRSLSFTGHFIKKRWSSRISLHYHRRVCPASQPGSTAS